jgi:lipopolysaccharide/colanic/teichoic acid biosynthesis glycosyltransferase
MQTDNQASCAKLSEYDAYYMDNKSIILDLKIVWMTTVNVLRKRGSKR